MREAEVRLVVHPRIAEALKGPENAVLAELGHRIDKKIAVEVQKDFHLEHYEFSAIDPMGYGVGRVFTERD